MTTCCRRTPPRPRSLRAPLPQPPQRGRCCDAGHHQGGMRGSGRGAARADRCAGAWPRRGSCHGARHPGRADWCRDQGDPAGASARCGDAAWTTGGASSWSFSCRPARRCTGGRGETGQGTQGRRPGIGIKSITQTDDRETLGIEGSTTGRRSRSSCRPARAATPAKNGQQGRHRRARRWTARRRVRNDIAAVLRASPEFIAATTPAQMQAEPWKAGIYRSGTLVAHYIGRLYCATKDTTDEPGDSPDWQRIGTAGERHVGGYSDARGFMSLAITTPRERRYLPFRRRPASPAVPEALHRRRGRARDRPSARQGQRRAGCRAAGAAGRTGRGPGHRAQGARRGAALAASNCRS